MSDSDCHKNIFCETEREREKIKETHSQGKGHNSKKEKKSVYSEIQLIVW